MRWGNVLLSLDRFIREQDAGEVVGGDSVEDGDVLPEVEEGEVVSHRRGGPTAVCRVPVPQLN